MGDIFCKDETTETGVAGVLSTTVVVPPAAFFFLFWEDLLTEIGGGGGSTWRDSLGGFCEHL